MNVVADAGPLISLSRIGRLALLPSLYDHVLIPPTVNAEIERGTGSENWGDWLELVPVQDEEAVHQLLARLDRGESEAIILARERAALLLVDERQGRAAAVALGLKVSGTVGVILAAKSRGFVEEVGPLLDALLAAGIRISQRLYLEAVELADEAPPSTV